VIVAQRVFGGPLQALFHLLCAFRFEFGDRQGTVGKRLTSSFPWSLRRQAGELSEPSTIDTNHPRPNCVIKTELRFSLILADAGALRRLVGEIR
jgi:hypothetical protein